MPALLAAQLIVCSIRVPTRPASFGEAAIFKILWAHKEGLHVPTQNALLCAGASCQITKRAMKDHVCKAQHYKIDGDLAHLNWCWSQLGAAQHTRLRQALVVCVAACQLADMV